MLVGIRKYIKHWWLRTAASTYLHPKRANKIGSLTYKHLSPTQVRSNVKKWADYIDYWAVDWNFQDDTFMQGWVAYRTRQDRSLPMTSDPHTYEKPGKYRILIKVIDIFGNDTSQAHTVEVK